LVCVCWWVVWCRCVWVRVCVCVVCVCLCVCVCAPERVRLRHGARRASFYHIFCHRKDPHVPSLVEYPQYDDLAQRRSLVVRRQHFALQASES